MSEFTAWLDKELENLGWGYNELGRRAGISSGGVSQVMTGRQNPGLDFCLKVAQALDEPPDRILRLAGLLPPLPGSLGEAELQEMAEVLKYLEDEERQLVFDFARWRLQEQRRRKVDPEGDDNG